MKLKIGDKVQYNDENEGLVGIVITRVDYGDEELTYQGTKTDSSGDTFWMYTAQIVIPKKKSKKKALVSSLSAKDIGRMIRIPLSSGAIVEGTLRYVKADPNGVTVGFEEFAGTYNANPEAKIKYV